MADPNLELREEVLFYCFFFCDLFSFQERGGLGPPGPSPRSSTGDFVKGHLVSKMICFHQQELNDTFCETC